VATLLGREAANLRDEFETSRFDLQRGYMLGVCLSNEWQVCLSGSGGSLTLSKAWRCEGSEVS